MLREALADGQPHRRGVGVQVGVHAGRRRRHGQAEDVVQQPLAAQDGRRPVGIGGGRQYRSMREQAPPLLPIREGDSPEPATLDAHYVIVLRQPFVDERVVGIQQVRDAAVFPQRAGDEQLGLAPEGLQQRLVVVRVAVRVDHHLLDAAQVEPLSREVAHQRVLGPGIGQHAAHLLFQDRRIGELPPLGQRQQAVVGDAAPQEERQARGDLQVAQAVGALAARQVDRFAVDAQQEVRIDQDALETVLDAGLEAAAVAPARVEERQQRLAVARRDGPPVGAAGRRGQDALGAGPLLGRAARGAEKDPAAARGVLRPAVDAVRAADLHRANGRVAHVYLVVGQHPAALQRLREAFRLPQLPHERDADHPRASLHRHAHLERGVAGHLHELFPARVAGEARLAGAGVAGRRRSAFHVAPDHEASEQPAVEAHLELLRPAHAHDVVLVLPAEAHLQEVLAVDGEVVPHGEAAPRAERQVLALPLVLHDVQRNLERLDARRHRGQAGREPRHLPRDRQVAFQVRPRDREHAREVVEAAVGRLVAGQQRPHVEAVRVDGEQVAQGVGVLRAVQPVDRGDAAGRGSGGPGPIDLRFQPAGHGAIRARVGARTSGRRHRARPQPADDALPQLGSGVRPGRVEAVERQPGGAQPIVVAGQAVAVHERPHRLRAGALALALAGRCRRGRGRRQHQRQDEGAGEQRQRRLPLLDLEEPHARLLGRRVHIRMPTCCPEVERIRPFNARIARRAAGPACPPAWRRTR